MQEKNIERNKKLCASKKTNKIFIARQNLDTFNEQTVQCHSVGNMVFTCSKCGAKIFKGDNTGSSFCCGKELIKLPPIKEPPNLLKNLLTGGTKHDHDFRTNIRA